MIGVALEQYHKYFGLNKMFLNGRQIKIASFFNQPPVVIYGTTILLLIGLQILNECGVVPLLTLTSTEVSLLTTLKSFLSPPPSL